MLTPRAAGQGLRQGLLLPGTGGQGRRPRRWRRPQSQQAIQRLRPPRVRRSSSPSNPLEVPLDAKALVAAFDQWDRDVGGGEGASRRLTRSPTKAFAGAAPRGRDPPVRRQARPARTSTLTIRRGEFIALLGPVGLRQVDRAELPGRAAAADRRADLAGRHAARHAAARAARLRHGVPELRAVPAHVRARNIAFGLQMHGVAAGRGAPAGRRGDPPGAPRGARRQAARPALRRPAAAGRDRPGGRARAVAGADGRAAVQPGRQAAAGDAHRDPPAAPVARAHHRLRDARPGGGAVAGRPPGGAARRPGAAGRHARGAAHPAGQPARGRLHGLPQPAAAAGASSATATRWSSRATGSSCAAPRSGRSSPDDDGVRRGTAGGRPRRTTARTA